VRKNLLIQAEETAGNFHSEMNQHYEVEHNIQTWILSEEAGLENSYSLE